MTERAYTLAEIDRMRELVRERMFRPMMDYVQSDGSRITLGDTVPNADVEDRLRTYMLAGISPDELGQKP